MLFHFCLSRVNVEFQAAFSSRHGRPSLPSYYVILSRFLVNYAVSIPLYYFYINPCLGFEYIVYTEYLCGFYFPIRIIVGLGQF